MKKITNLSSFPVSTWAMAMIFSIVLIYSSCKKDPVPPPPPVKVESCTDGIKNQGEGDIDCGGPCASCKGTICEGSTSTSYYPLKMDNEWVYEGSGGLAGHSAKIEDTYVSVNTGKGYFNLFYHGKSGGMYLRTETNGDIIELKVNPTNEYVRVPANPTVGQVFATYPSGANPASSKVAAIDETVVTGKCTYTGVLKIEDLNGSGSVVNTLYYKKGLGLIKEVNAAGGTATLNTVTLK